jgi:hypothetical protein
VIHYKIGSPEKHSIAANSSATVLSVDVKSNTLTVETSTGHETSYNPALLKQQTKQSTVYREEERDLVVATAYSSQPPTARTASARVTSPPSIGSRKTMPSSSVWTTEKPSN